jgi:Ca2+-transporting ATPase
MVIGVVVAVNTVLGFIQEYRAEKGLEALKEMLVKKAKVIRDGKIGLVEVEKVVVGDVVVLEIGRIVPADGEILESSGLEFDEAILTGESVAVAKAVGKEAYMGTTVAKGIGKMKVIKIGRVTKMGKIAKSLVEEKETKTPLQEKLAKLSKSLAILVGVIAVAIFVIGILVGDPIGEMFELSVAIAVAAIPEGLVVSLTVILALGMQRMAKRKALVRKLVSAETLGSVTVICLDKTGTLTEGKMKAVKGEFVDEKLGWQSVLACNDYRDPLEVAMAELAKTKTKDKKRSRVASIPFDPEYKYIATLHDRGELFVSGAPEIILKKSSLSLTKSLAWRKKFKEYGKQGYRLVGFAHRNFKTQMSNIKHGDIKNLKWLGVVVFEDPVRAGVADALVKAQGLGLKLKVITGDYEETTLAVVSKLKAQNSKLKIKEIEIFARAAPEDKLEIVEKLQKKKEIVAMMGDGVNDAPALKKADIGIVVGGASDVARETADMVLLDSNFETILKAIREGWGILENLKKSILYLLSDSFSEVVLITGGLILGLPLPLTAVQILWINLLTDGFPHLALTMESTAMAKKDGKGELIDKEMRWLIGLISGATGLITLGVFWWLMRSGADLVYSRTLIFAMLGIDSLLYVFSARALRKPIWKSNIFANKYLLIAVGLGVCLQLLALYWVKLEKVLETVPLGIGEWGLILGMAVVVIMLIEAVKAIFNHRES